jgi:hypothetical protein
MTPLRTVKCADTTSCPGDAGTSRGSAPKVGSMHEQNTPGDGPVVYTIQAEWGGPIKIGYCASADAVCDRLGGIQTGNPHRLVVRRVIPGSRQLERLLHERYARYRMAGEWFLNAPEVAMGTGAKLPGTRELARIVKPAMESSFRAGVDEGKRLHEIHWREHIRWFLEHVGLAFDEDEYPSETERAMEVANRQLARLLGPSVKFGPDTIALHTSDHTAEAEVA